MSEPDHNVRYAPSFDQLAQELRREEIEKSLDSKDCASLFQAAEKRYEAKEAGIERLEDPCARLYALFKLLVDEKEGRLRWQALKDHAPRNKFWDADSQIAELWTKIEDCCASQLVDGHWSVIYHRLWLFDWLLQRYDVRRARTVVGGKRWARNAHFVLLILIAGIFVLRRIESFRSYQTLGALILCGLVYAAVIAGLAATFKVRNRLPDRLEAFAVATHSLIPRLAGASAVGLLFLASSRELIPVILSTNGWWLIGFLAAGYGYLLLEMARRVHPLPRLRRLALHALDISATALSHSLALTLLAEGVLWRLIDETGGSYRPLGLQEAFSLVVFVFSIGLVVNVIWAEQPVTEPL